MTCIEQEGFKCKRPVSDVAEITVPTRFLSNAGTYKCIPEGYSHENIKACQFDQSGGQQKEPQDKSQKERSLANPDGGGIIFVSLNNDFKNDFRKLCTS